MMLPEGRVRAARERTACTVARYAVAHRPMGAGMVLNDWFDRREDANVLRGADLVVDVDRHRVLRGDESVDLTPTEFRILETLLRQPGHVLSARQIVSAVWGAE